MRKVPSTTGPGLVARLLDLGILAAAAGLVVFAVAWWLSPASVLLLDRQRENLDPPDLVLRYLRVTQTPYEFEGGFVKLRGGAVVEERLLRLLANLQRGLEAVARSEEFVRSPGPGRPAVLTLNAEGGLDILPDLRPIHTPEERERRRVELSLLRRQLEEQSQTVQAALQILRPGAVGPERLPTEEVASVRQPLLPAALAPPAAALAPAEPAAPLEPVEFAEIVADP